MFSQVLASWGSEAFSVQFKQAIKSLPIDKLPLQLCCQHSGVIEPSTVESTILTSQETQTHIRVTTGVFFQEILSGCACSDDPSQAQILENGYCEFDTVIDKQTANFTFTTLR